MLDETWKALPGFEGRYEVSTMGRVRRPGGEPLKLFLTSDGYQAAGLPVAGRMKNHRVHRLIAMAFLGTPIAPRVVVNHIDFDRLNNQVDNLEWVTPGENVRHTLRAGRLRPPIPPRGSACHTSRLSAAQVAAIISLKGIVATKTLALLCGVSTTAIRKIHRGETWREFPEVRHG